MGIINYLITLCIFIPCKSTDQCTLKDGIYKVVYDQPEYRKFKTKFKVDGELMTITEKDEEFRFKIRWLDESRFTLDPLEERTTQLTDFEKSMRSLGTPYYELINCYGKTIEYEHMQNLHITITTGKLVLVD